MIARLTRASCRHGRVCGWTFVYCARFSQGARLVEQRIIPVHVESTPHAVRTIHLSDARWPGMERRAHETASASAAANLQVVAAEHTRAKALASARSVRITAHDDAFRPLRQLALFEQRLMPMDEAPDRDAWHGGPGDAPSDQGARSWRLDVHLAAVLIVE